MSPLKLWISKSIAQFLPESRFFAFKNILLRWSGARIGKNVRIYSSAKVVGTGSLEIGDDVHIGSGVFISVIAPAIVKIGNCVDIAPEVMILTGSHEINLSEEFEDSLNGHMAGKGTEASVEIGNGSWVGARTLILPGISLPAKTITAAGAIVTKSLAVQKMLLAGVPAKVKKQY